MKTTAVLLAAVTLSCAAGVGASSASAAGTPTPTTPDATSSASGGTTAAVSPATTPASTDVTGTPGVPKRVPDAPARVRAVVTRYALSASSWAAGGAAPTIGLRLDASRATSARVQVRVQDYASGKVVLRQTFGVVRSGVDVTDAVTPRLATLPGRYRLSLIVRDQTGRRTVKAHTLRVQSPTTAAADTKAPIPGATYVFPVQGACNFRSLASQRFHSAREPGRVHNGQDIGTYSAFPPVVAYTAATVSQVFYDDEGGGWTIVFNGDDGIAYGYLHLKAGSILVKPGDRVTPGERVANAGNTGGDYEPHLHFEMRPIPWDSNHDNAIDPMPYLVKLPNPCDG